MAVDARQLKPAMMILLCVSSATWAEPGDDSLPPPPQAQAIHDEAVFQLALVLNHYDTGLVVPVTQRKGAFFISSADLLRAGLVGGAICVVGQALVNLYEHWGASAATAATWCSITLVFLGALLTGLGVYDDLARFAGAGSLVPITGFANSVVSPALEFKTEGFVTGTAVKIFTIAGPVIVYGISASVIYGLILAVFGLV